MHGVKESLFALIPAEFSFKERSKQKKMSPGETHDNGHC